MVKDNLEQKVENLLISDVAAILKCLIKLELWDREFISIRNTKKMLERIEEKTKTMSNMKKEIEIKLAAVGDHVDGY